MANIAVITGADIVEGMTLIGGHTVRTVAHTDAGVLVTFVDGGHNGYPFTGRVYCEVAA